MDQFLIFFIAMVFGVASTWITRFFALKAGIVNAPNPIIPQHRKPVAYLGGVGVFGGIFFGLLYCWFFQRSYIDKLLNTNLPSWSLIIGAVGCLVLGIFDDLMALKARTKFAWQFVIAVVCVILGLRTNLFASPFLDYLISVFWIATVINALNFTDVCDGLVGTICVATFLTAGICMGSGNSMQEFSFLVAGGTMGFLFFNWPKASIFLGDAGSHLLGFLLAALSIYGGRSYEMVDEGLWSIFLASVPLFELTFITSIRMHRGMPWWKGSPDHFSLRLQQAGLHRWQVDAIAAAYTILFVSVACVLPGLGWATQLGIVAATIVVYAVSWRLLLRWEVPKKIA